MLGFATKTGFEEGSCYGNTCTFGQFCSHTRDFKSCRDCWDLVVWCLGNRTEFQELFPACGYICQLQDSWKAANATALMCQEEGLDHHHYILIAACLFLVMMLLFALGFACCARTLRKLLLKLTGICCKKMPSVASSESTNLMSQQNSESPQECLNTDGVSSNSSGTDSCQFEQAGEPLQPSAPSLQDDVNKDYNNGTTASATALITPDGTCDNGTTASAAAPIIPDGTCDNGTTASAAAPITPDETSDDGITVPKGTFGLKLVSSDSPNNARYPTQALDDGKDRCDTVISMSDFCGRR